MHVAMLLAYGPNPKGITAYSTGAVQWPNDLWPVASFFLGWTLALGFVK